MSDEVAHNEFSYLNDQVHFFPFVETIIIIMMDLHKVKDILKDKSSAWSVLFCNP